MTAIDTQGLLHTYDCLASTTGHMLEAAKRGDWDRLVELEKRCAELIARMTALETEDPLPQALRARKAAMIRKVLADDAEIRNITEPWLQQLGAMLNANGKQQRLLQTYGPPREG